MHGPQDIVYREHGWASLRQVAEALRSIDGVQSADAHVRAAPDGDEEIVGVLTVSEGAGLTPLAVLEAVKRAYPSSCWPDRVLLTFEGPPQAIGRAA